MLCVCDCLLFVGSCFIFDVCGLVCVVRCLLAGMCCLCVCCCLFVCCSVFVVCFVFCLSPVVGHLSFVARCLCLLVVCLLVVACCVLFVAVCMFVVVCWLWFRVWCLAYVVCCLFEGVLAILLDGLLGSLLVCCGLGLLCGVFVCVFLVDVCCLLFVVCR